MLLALANPKLSGLRINLNSGNISAISSGVPSVEALSTTITSEHSFEHCSRNDPRHSITYFLAFQTTMTTETRAGPASGWGDNDEGNGSVLDSAIMLRDSVLPASGNSS